jgi:L-amino acid N-acyltransferase YncA
MEIDFLKDENLPLGFAFKECDVQEFDEIVGNLKETVFSDNAICIWPKEFLSELETEKLKALNQGYTENYKLYLILFKEGQLVGWSFGYQDTKESFVMASSAVLPEFRGKGYYGLLLDRVLQTVTAQGFQRIWSLHKMSNNQIIIPKLRRGFVIAGTKINEMSGAMVELVYLMNKTRKELMQFRTGYKPGKELKSLLKL